MSDGSSSNTELEINLSAEQNSSQGELPVVDNVPDTFVRAQKSPFNIGSEITEKTSRGSVSEPIPIDSEVTEEKGIPYWTSPKTGKKYPLEVAGGAGAVPDPEAVDLASPDALRGWAEEQLRAFERLSNRPIEVAFMNSLLSTIAARTPNFPGLAAMDLKQELMRKVRARVRYHNASIKASIGLDGFGAEFNDIQRDEHIEIFRTQGVREAVEQLVSNDGAFFRLEDAVADTQRAGIRGFLETGVLAGIADITKRREAVVLALELAEKTAHIFGVSAYYDGIRTPGDIFVEPPPAVLNAIPGEPRGARSRRILDWYQTYFEHNYEGIDFDRSFKGQGAGHMRNIFYAPIRLRREDEGDIDYLRRFAYLRITDAVHYLEQGSLPALMDKVINEGLRLGDWGGSVTAAHTARKALFDKESSILNVPLIDPDGVQSENTSSTLPKALENYRKGQEAYAHLSPPERKRAMGNLLKGVLFYVNNRRITAADGFTWNGWNQKIVLDTLMWAERERIISREEVLSVERDLRTSRNIAALQAATPELRKGLFAGIGAFFKAVTGGK